MKFLFDLFPVILFFISFKWGESHPAEAQAMVARHVGHLIEGGVVTALQAPILLATAVAIVAAFVQIAWLLVRRKKIDTMLWLSVAIITVFGGATIYFHSDVFIKWKPTILYWCFAAALLGGLLRRRNFIRQVMGSQIELPDPVWHKLALSWGAFFVAMGLLNLYIAFNFPTGTWVNFKLFGGMGLTFVFVIGQSFFLARHMKEPE